MKRRGGILRHAVIPHPALELVPADIVQQGRPQFAIAPDVQLGIGGLGGQQGECGDEVVMGLGFYQPANGSEPDDRPGGSRRRPERLEPPDRDAVRDHRAFAGRDRPLFRVVALPVLADEHHRIGQRHGGAVVDFLAARR